MCDKVTYALDSLGEALGRTPTIGSVQGYVERYLRTILEYWQLVQTESQREQFGIPSVRLLDFDVIEPLWWHDDLAGGSGPTSRVAFPATAQLFFGQTQRDFALPPGTVYEYSERLLHKAGELPSEAGATIWPGVIRFVQDRVRHGQIGHGLLESALDTMPAACWAETPAVFAQLRRAGQRLGRRQANSPELVFEHARHRPWGELPHAGCGARTIYPDTRRFWAWFTKGAPEAEHAAASPSLNDLAKRQRDEAFVQSLNVATFLALHRPRRHGTESRPGRPYHAVFTSGHWFCQRAQSLAWLDPRDIDSATGAAWSPPRVPSSQYLAFATAIEAYAEHSNTVLATLAADAVRLLNRVVRAWAAIVDQVALSGVPPEALSDLPLAQIRHLECVVRFGEFYRRWLQTHLRQAAEFLRVAELDRQYVRDYRALGNAGGDWVDHHLDELLGPLLDPWHAVPRARDSAPAVPTHPHEAALDLTRPRAQDGGHQVELRHRGRAFPVLTIREDADGSTWCAWPRRSRSRTELLSAGRGFLAAACAAPAGAAEASVMLYSTDTAGARSFELNLDADDEWADMYAAGEAVDCHFCTMDSRRTAVYLNFYTPGEPVEPRVSVLSAGGADSAWLAALGTLHGQTALIDLPRAVLAEWLERGLAGLRAARAGVEEAGAPCC